MTTSSSLTRRGFLDQTLKAGAAGLISGAVSSASVRAAGEQAREDRWQIGCYTRPWDKHDYRVALDAIAEAGFKYAGLMTTTTKPKRRLVISASITPEQAEQIGKEVKQRGMQIPSVYGGGISVQASLEAAIEALRRLIDNCAAAGAKTLLMGGTGAKYYDRYFKAIAECCDYAAEKRVGITIKPHGGRNATGPQCRKAIETVGHKNFRLWYDPGNIFYYSKGQLDPVKDAATVDGLVVGMCVKDYKHPKQVMLTPGTGQVDFPAVMARLKQGGFTSGALVVECLTRGDLPAMLAEARKARTFVEELVGQRS